MTANRMLAVGVKSLITAFSGNEQSYTLKRKGGVTIVDGAEVVTPPSQTDVSGIMATIRPEWYNGTTIKAGDRTMIINEDYDIRLGDIIVIDGVSWTVTDPRPVKPGNVIVGYRPVLRSGPAA